MDVVRTAPPQHLKEPPAKRARVGPAKVGNSARIVTKRGRAGCLSDLPTVPLDVLFEVRSLRYFMIEDTSGGLTLLRSSVIFILRICFR